MSDDKAQYKLTERAYIGDALLEPETVITYEGIPGHHMEPVNDAARAMKKKHASNSKYIDPIEAMTVVN